MTSSFDRYGKTYTQEVQASIAFSGLKHDFFVNAKVARLQRLFASHFGMRKPALADIGCGIGSMHGPMLPLCDRIAACDPSADCVARAREANPPVAYQQADGRRLPWHDRSFDVALAVCVFHHVPPAERPAMLQEMRRIVVPGGLLVLIEHNPWNPGTRLAVSRCEFDDDAILLDWREARRLLTVEGLAVSIEHFLLLPFANAVAARIERATVSLPLGAQYLAAGIIP